MKRGNDKHHIIPKSRGGTDSKDNVIIVNKKKHQAYHLLFINATPEEAVLILIRDWFYQNPELREKWLYWLIDRLIKIAERR